MLREFGSNSLTSSLECPRTILKTKTRNLRKEHRAKAKPRMVKKLSTYTNMIR